jgi:hypothetical protein
VADWLRRILPAGAHPALDAVLTPRAIAAVSLLSLLLFAASLLALPWLVGRLPADYFCRREERRPPSVVRNRRVRLLLRIAKNVTGAVLLLSGIAMLVLPGQGLLTILMGLVLLRFPGKRALLRRVVARPPVLGALNALRRRAGVAPLLVDGLTDAAQSSEKRAHDHD